MSYFRVEAIDSREEFTANKIDKDKVFDSLSELFQYCVLNEIIMDYYKVIEFISTSGYKSDDKIIGFCILQGAFWSGYSTLNFKNNISR